MAPGVILLYVLQILIALAWELIGWSRLLRNVRYFQLEGYDSRRYLNWWIHNREELRFTVVSLIVVLLIAFGIPASVAIVGFLADPCPFNAYDCSFDFASSSALIITVFVLAGGAALLIYGLIRFRPRDKEVKQKFTATQRGIRLLVTALILDTLPALLFVNAISKGPFDLTPSFEALASGVIIVTFSPLMLPLANLINWPVEEAFRQYYLSLAKRNLKRCGATVIAITGSYGKTSTKHYLSHILSARYRVLMTPKSYNTLLGISRVINDILAGDNSYDYFLAEAGAYIPGEIARICKLVEPKISMVTAVGPMHLERFGSMENVVKAKYEIVESLPPDGVCVFNGDDPLVRDMAERGYPQNRLLITRQEQAGARLVADNIRMTADGLDFDVRDTQTGEKVAMHAPLYGHHNVSNILMAAGVAITLGLSLKEIGLRVATLEPAEHRLHRRVMPDGTILIDDAYSANPVGTQTALEVLALQQAGRRVVISSGMFELGPISDEENRKLGERMAAVATDVILIGPTQVEPVRQGLIAKGFPSDHLHIVNTLNEAVSIYRGILKPGDALLVLTDLPDTYA